MVYRGLTWWNLTTHLGNKEYFRSCIGRVYSNTLIIKGIYTGYNRDNVLLPVALQHLTQMLCINNWNIDLQKMIMIIMTLIWLKTIHTHCKLTRGLNSKKVNIYVLQKNIGHKASNQLQNIESQTIYIILTILFPSIYLELIFKG